MRYQTGWIEWKRRWLDFILLYVSLHPLILPLTIQQNNCGSITPGVLRSCIPHAKDLHAFSLGLSFSLTDMDVFTFLGEIHDLQFLTLQYYRVSLVSSQIIVSQHTSSNFANPQTYLNYRIYVN